MQTIATEHVTPDQLTGIENLAEQAEPTARGIILEVARAIREGNALVALDPTETFTPIQAATKLGMSRTHLYKLLDQGAIQHHRVGRDRRINAADLLAFEEQRRADRAELAERFARQQQTAAEVIDEIADLL